jgi:hypothetical protein
MSVTRRTGAQLNGASFKATLAAVQVATLFPHAGRSEIFCGSIFVYSIAKGFRR